MSRLGGLSSRHLIDYACKERHGLSCRNRSPPLSPRGSRGHETPPAHNPHPAGTDTPSHNRPPPSHATLPSARSQSSNVASHQQPISATREKADAAARVRSREADDEAAVAEQPAKRSRTSKWDQQDSDAVPVVALPAQVGTAHVQLPLLHRHVQVKPICICAMSHDAPSPPLPFPLAPRTPFVLGCILPGIALGCTTNSFTFACPVGVQLA